LDYNPDKVRKISSEAVHIYRDINVTDLRSILTTRLSDVHRFLGRFGAFIGSR